MLLLRNSIRGVLFDKSGSYTEVCNYNQFVCVSDYEYAHAALSPADLTVKHSSRCCPRCWTSCRR